MQIRSWKNSCTQNENRFYSISLGVASLQGGWVGLATALSPATVGHFKFLLHYFFVGLGLDVGRIPLEDFEQFPPLLQPHYMNFVHHAPNDEIIATFPEMFTGLSSRARSNNLTLEEIDRALQSYRDVMRTGLPKR